jgi:hypothetical protein
MVSTRYARKSVHLADDCFGHPSATEFVIATATNRTARRSAKRLSAPVEN